MREQTVKQVCNHKSHGLRYVFCTGTEYFIVRKLTHFNPTLGGLWVFAM